MAIVYTSKKINVEEITEQIRMNSYKLHDLPSIDPLMEKIGDARFVLLGEATHGTHEFYTWRTKITKRLIEEKGFNFIGVEGDWPDCYKINRYIKDFSFSGNSAKDVLREFNRWPTWMWANWEIVALVEWLKRFNSLSEAPKKVGFYGLDVYSLWESLDAIVKYIENKHPETLDAVKRAIKCFDPYSGDEGDSYARATHMVPFSCREEVVNMLKEIRRNARHYDGDREAAFCAEQNAVVAVNAEEFYRKMIHSGTESWNVRDRHMMDTLTRLMVFHGPESKAIIWEHNTHIGDARATDMSRQKMVNIGQLLREGHKEEDVFLAGFGTFEGTVIAAEDWGAPMEEMDVPEALENSWEWLVHISDPSDQLLLMDDLKKSESFGIPINHRAIGVVYHPEKEKYGNYVPSIIEERYDAFIHCDRTSALHALHIKPDGHLMPATYPFEE